MFIKKLVMFFILLSLLVACGDAETEQSEAADNQVTEETVAETEDEAATEEDPEDTITVEEETEEIVEEQETMTLTNENINEIVEFNGTGEGDELINAVIENGEVKAEIKLASNDLLPVDLLAISRYSSVSDELLQYEGWETLTVEYVEVGTISMNRAEAVTDEWDMTYFPSDVIESKIN